jgi:acyl carrier protein
MNKDEILERVGDVIRDALDQPDLEVTTETTADTVDGWDSFNHLNIVAAVEAQFRIKINTAEIEEFKNVGDLIELVERKLGARK